MTEIREPNYRIDLPGDWEQAESAEPVTTVFRESAGPGRVSVTLLGVKPMYAIADQRMLLEQYLQHRAQFERGDTSLEASDAVVVQEDDSLEAAWSGYDPETGRRTLHRVMLLGGMLADFSYEASEPDVEAFAERAHAVLASAAAAVE